MNIICLISIALTVCDFVTALYKFMGSKYRKFKTYRNILRWACLCFVRFIAKSSHQQRRFSLSRSHPDNRPPPGPDFRTTQCTLPGDMGYTNQNYGGEHEVILTRDTVTGPYMDQGVQAVDDPQVYSQQIRFETLLFNTSSHKHYHKSYLW